jgi:mono/diheme cytochrome c family protein
MAPTRFLLPAVLAGALGVTAYAGMQSVDPETLPEGEGRDILFRACADCHDIGTVVLVKRRTPRQWGDVTTDMITKGVKAEEAEIATLVRYLAINAGHVNVNRATEADLKTYVGFEEAQAAVIVAARGKGTTFKSLDDLRALQGLDATALDKLKDRIVFTDR